MFRKILTLSSLVLVLSISTVEAKQVFKFGHLANENHTWNKAAVYFSELVKERTNGEIEIQVYPNGQLGKEIDMINGMKLGTVDMTITGETLQNWAPKAALLAVPYAIKDDAHMNRVVNGEVGKEIADEIIKNVKIRPLTWFARGPRNLTSNKAIKDPSDLNGMKMRVPNVPLFLAVWEELGASPTPMAFSEVFTSLQQHIIEGQENPYALIKSASFFEVQKFVNKTEHVRSWIYITIGEKQFQKLSKKNKAIMKQAASDAHYYEYGLFKAGQSQLEQELKAKGMTIVEVNKDAFMSKSKKAVLKFLSPSQKKLYDKIGNLK